MPVIISRFTIADYRTEINTHYYKFEFRNSKVYIGNFNGDIQILCEDIDTFIKELSYFRDTLKAEGLL